MTPSLLLGLAISAAMQSPQTIPMLYCIHGTMPEPEIKLVEYTPVPKPTGRFERIGDSLTNYYDHHPKQVRWVKFGSRVTLWTLNVASQVGNILRY